MALEFLTKKKWNPSNTKVLECCTVFILQNREQVWLREQALEKEKKKVAELQKQLQEERRRNELRRLQNGDTAEEDTVFDFIYLIYELVTSKS